MLKRRSYVKLRRIHYTMWVWYSTIDICGIMVLLILSTRVEGALQGV